MRWLLALLAIAVSGCIDSSGGVFQVGLDCSSNQAVVVAAQADLLMSASVPDEVREPFGPIARITVPARAGQTLTAVATWAAAGGDINARYDGPTASEVETGQTWSSTGGRVQTTGNYTLELEGAPIAAQVTYTLSLIASGCTPLPSSG
ncbi:MAG: hypothetical protein WC876_01560 [Candidatus Thermoplasmatota archaeon]|jgi:hypothetical protein